MLTKTCMQLKLKTYKPKCTGAQNHKKIYDIWLRYFLDTMKTRILWTKLDQQNCAGGNCLIVSPHCLCNVTRSVLPSNWMTNCMQCMQMITDVTLLPQSSTALCMLSPSRHRDTAVLNMYSSWSTAWLQIRKLLAWTNPAESDKQHTTATVQSIQTKTSTQTEKNDNKWTKHARGWYMIEK